MADRFNNTTILVLKRLFGLSRQRRRRSEATLRILMAIRRRRIQVAVLLALLLSASARARGIHVKRRSCRRFSRNTGWWEHVWQSYTNSSFKKTFRISRETFSFILSQIRHKLERQVTAENPISPECRLGICLYRLGRGDYMYTIAEMAGIGTSTVSVIVSEVCAAIVECIWEEFVNNILPKTDKEFEEKMLDTEELWQFPYSWAAVDGCHIPITCPPGGLQSCKEYHNFKHFYSVVLMAMVDAKYRFVWGSCGFPGNSHDSVILQSTNLWKKIKEGCFLPGFINMLHGTSIPPLIIGNSAFPFEEWLMKPYTNGSLTPPQWYFNYRLSCARMVIEGAFGQLKGRWCILMRKSESSQEEVKMFALSCMVLHNVCLQMGDAIPSKLDLSIDPNTQQTRDRKRIREICMLGCQEEHLNLEEVRPTR